MTARYHALLTNIGAAKLANATALGEQVNITQMAVGDGNGVLPVPSPAQTALVHELRRAPLNTLTIDPVNASQIIAEQVIPEGVGGWWIREIGLYDSDGDLVAIANCAETYKPRLQEGSGRVQVIRVMLLVSSTQAVTLRIDPSIVLATRQYVDDAIVAMIAASPGALDTLNELAAALGDDPNFAATVTSALAGKMDKARNGADIADIPQFLRNLGLGEGSALPVGVPIPWPLATPPTGWIKCNGATFTAATYPKLALAYPALRVPDLRGEFIRGWDDGRGVDAGRALQSTQADEYKAHDHAIYTSNGQYGTGSALSILSSTGGAYIKTLSISSATSAPVIQSSGGNEIRPRNMALNYIVRAA